MMKAWQVSYNDTTAIVFAPTQGKAKSIALQHDLLDDEFITFIDIDCWRRKEADQFYTGKQYLDWLCDEDRLLMVKELGFTCVEEFYQERECACCAAKKYCSLYEWLKEREET